MNNKGFAISIPQIVMGVVSMFLAILGMRIVVPIIQPILDMTWKSNVTKAGTMIGVYAVMVFIIYIIVYGTVTGRKPNIMGDQKSERGLFEI